MEWKELMIEEMNKPYFSKLNQNIKTLYQEKIIFPPYDHIYQALLLTPIDDVKVVIIGQDPYQTPGFANGLAFSVNKGIKLPKSLQNIFKELVDDLHLPYPSSGDLTPWAKNGVLLLNRILTVESGKSLSHKDMGWEIFTEAVIRKLNLIPRKLVFILLGNQARTIKQFLNNPNHLIIEAPHPSPLSAYQGFFGSKIFSRTCKYLNLPYDYWRLPWKEENLL